MIQAIKSCYGVLNYGRSPFTVVKTPARDDRGTLFSDTRKCLKDEVCEVLALEVPSSHSKRSKAQLGEPDLE